MALDVRTFTVGPFAENSYIVRAKGAESAFMVDPGDEAPKLLQAIDALGVKVEAILLTHCHIDHIGAVAPVATATGAPVYCPEGEVDWLKNINDYVRWPGLGPFEGWDPEHTVSGGEKLSVAGFDIEVLFTPGHSPGHVTYSIEGEKALFSGDVLFQSSIGRTDLPGGDHQTLLASIASLMDRFDGETVVFPGHMGVTTLARERTTNPFLTELAR